MAANKRSEIVVLKQARHNTRDVASRVGVDPETVYSIKKRYCETGSIDSGPIPVENDLQGRHNWPMSSERESHETHGRA
ncbi:Arf-GAP domain and FG repeat-containing protein 1 [Octopus vulgaris]|uniref:Arf-GAP domain and FG repeat-containing protein 1 n=1 Tax=Octopus vulgaris TaxID=6645 RepID=A0AA36AXF2_OCTVU|nr:Arf-GAP domain and FG repeat-containing protein 1 [Octopus vulgaris]